MRIGMEEAEGDHLVERRPNELVGEPFSISTHAVEACRVGNSPSFEPFLYQQATRAQMAIHRRDSDASRMVEPAGHLVHRVGLAQEVELGPQTLSELLEDVARPYSPTKRCAPLGEVGDEAERCQVALDRLWIPGRWILTTTASPVCSRAM